MATSKRLGRHQAEAAHNPRMSRVDEETEGHKLPPPEDKFQTLWNRIKENATEVLHDDLVMSVALEAQRSVRKGNA